MWALWSKQAEALGAGLPDQAKSTAAALPAAPIAVENKPAPGLKGPAGLAPRTSYSRVNTGAPTISSAGIEQKSVAPRGLESLRKVAHKENSMAQMVTRPALQELVKAAMEGSISKVDIGLEASRLAAQRGEIYEQAKTAAIAEPDSIPTDYCEKVAEALDYLSKEAAIQISAGTSSGVGPGEGPNALAVSTPSSKDSPIGPGQQGQGRTQPPKDPPMAAFSDSKSPANAMATNIDMQHGEQPVDPMHNEHASIAAQKTAELENKNLAVLRKLAKPETKEEERHEDHEAAESPKKEKEEEKKASTLLLKNLEKLGLKKTAEDAINPAQISGGKAEATGAEAPVGVSAAGEGPIPSEPSDVNSQKRLISSIDAAINYTKGEAKADPKKDLGHILTEPALSSATDKTLAEAFDSTAKAGVKIASEKMVKTAAAHALLTKLAAEVASDKAKKEKSANLGTTSQDASGFSAPALSNPVSAQR